MALEGWGAGGCGAHKEGEWSWTDTRRCHSSLSRRSLAWTSDARRSEQARRLAERYDVELIDMESFRIDQELFRSIPADLMLRYGFVPYRRDGKALKIVVSDPTDLPMIDELSVLLASPIKVAVGPRSAIESILKKSESSQRVLEDATESFQLQLLKEDEGGDDKPHGRAAHERY